MADSETPDKKTELNISAPASIFGLVLAAIITGVLAFLLGLARRRAAIERNKALVLEEQLEQVKEKAKLDENQKVRDEAAKKILELQEKVDNSTERLEALDEQHEDYVKQLKKVNSWDDLFKE